MDNQRDIQVDESIDMNRLLNMADKTPVVPSETTNESGDHGNFVKLEDGEVGIYIDPTHEMNKMIESVKNEKMDNLINEDIPMYEKVGAIGKDAHSIDYGSILINADPNSEDARSIMQVKEAFSQFSPSSDGLVPKDSEQAEIFESAIEALRSGEYVLPTVEQYNQQRLEIQKQKEQEAQKRMQEQNNVHTSEIQHEQKVINLAAMEEQAAHRQEPSVLSEETPVSAQNMQPKEIAEFRVPEGRVHDFVDTLTSEERKKVETSKVIEVKEVREVEVPVATKTITNINQYKRIAPKRVTAEAVEVPLLNSGYVAVVKGCGSLEMASILPNIEDMEWDDYAKLYTFCYNNLVSASIGYMSYSRFCVKTSPDDLPAMIHAILRASVPDEQSVTLTCGTEHCGKDYDITYSLKDLADLDTVGQDSLDRIDQLMAVKNVVDDARKVQEESPVMIQKYINIGDGRTVCLRNPNGPIVVERTKQELIDKISTKYSEFVALFLLYVEKIIVQLEDDNGKPDIYDLIDPEVIAEEIQTFSDTQLEILKEEMRGLTSYPQYTYSFKGKNGKPIVCPYCKLENKRIPCKVQQLVFRRVSRAMN